MVKRPGRRHLRFWGLDCEEELEDGTVCGKDGYIIKGTVFCRDCWNNREKEGE